MTEAVPYFDDTRKALTFALNFEGDLRVPTMTRLMVMSQQAPRKVTKAMRKRVLAQFDPNGLHPDLRALAEKFLAGGESRKSAGSAPPTPKGLDGAHLAGWVLAHFSRLDENHQTLLRGRALQAYSRCSCGSSCCSGWRRQPRWAQAVKETCLHLEKVGDVLREGKRGLSSQPEMRLAIVEQFYTNSEMSVTSLARIGHVTMVTASKHKEWICAYLEQEERNAWAELDAIFDSSGITGAFS